MRKNAYVGITLLVLLGCATIARADEPDRWSQFRAEQQAELATLPPPVADPKCQPGENPIDAFVRTWRASESLKPRPARPAFALLRALWLDAVGLLPPPEDVQRFAAEVGEAPGANEAKIQSAVNSLLADRRAYAEHWITFWNDLVRNDEQTNIDGLRKPITAWLYEALRDNMAYDRMVTELLSPGPGGPDGYLKGVNWRGRVNLSQRPAVQAAQNVAQVFLATSIRCASCHDGFTTSWKLKDAYGLASFFSESRLEMARCDKPTGVFVPAKFLYADLGEVNPDADLPARQAAVAHMVTRPKNERFAKVIVNRLWHRLLGRPLTQPLDELDEPDFPALLDWLAYDFMQHDYDLKHTIALILTSHVYREIARDPASNSTEEPADPGPVPRRITSEQFLDVLASVTGHWPRPAQLVNVRLDGDHVRAWRHKRPSALASALGRPNREQVVTNRVQEATVLQALEMTNGATLNSLLADGADALLASPWGAEPNPEKAVESLTLRAFARSATPAERALLAALIGKPGDDPVDRKAGLEDALWMIANSPEFQLLR
ncbi:MAG TPA: DUF1553 domain-containing protein [Isosphaeraceae bacterium]|nr:DUF1553 domain-containing protein [Isosphaeraceae bacterium]